MSDFRTHINCTCQECATCPCSWAQLVIGHVCGPVTSLNRNAVDVALRKVIEHLDYDTHKMLECDEETGEDTYGEHVERFIAEYEKAGSS